MGKILITLEQAEASKCSLSICKKKASWLWRYEDKVFLVCDTHVITGACKAVDELDKHYFIKTPMGKHRPI